MDFLPKMGGDLASSAFNMLGSWATGGFKGRPQWRDLNFMNDVQNRLWPDEIKRQGQFLEGLAPSQATAHNTFQDQTYLADVTRKTQGIQQMSKDLGMSPWEITGTGGAATPLPSMPSQPSGGGGQMGQFLQGIMPLKLAQMQNMTALKIAQMSNETQRYGIDMSGGQSPQAKQQIAASKALQTLTELQSATEVQRSAQIQSDIFLANIRTLTDMLPSFQTGVPGASMTGKSGTYPLLQAMRKQINTGTGDPTQALRDAAGNIDTNRTNQLAKEISALAKAATNTAQSFGQTIMQFLPNMKQ